MTDTMLRLFTSESVTEGHPDKVCDQVSDAILDALLAQDPNARVAVETLAAKGFIQVAGEVTTDAYVEIPEIVRQTVNQIGYTSSRVGFDGNTCGVNVAIGAQSEDIAQGVNLSQEVRENQSNNTDKLASQGAGDQGLMFGYACTDTPNYMPIPIDIAHKIAIQIAKVRKENVLPDLGPDGKTQVTIGYEGQTPKSLTAVVVSTQHSNNWDITDLSAQISQKVIYPVLEQHVSHLNIDHLKTYVNPTGKFVIGGPGADTGITGRKLIVDTYGGMARHGGGAFSGKDASKVDRSAAYAMRWVAKHVVAAGLAKRCEIQVAYAIGRAEPVGIFVETFDSATVAEDKIAKAIRKTFDLRPAAIVEAIELKRPIFSKTAAYGHFGRENKHFTWEQLNHLEEITRNIA